MKSFRLVKWSSWSLINESPLNTLAVCSLLPSAESCHPGQPLLDHTMHFWQLFLGLWATMVRMGLSKPWVVHDPISQSLTRRSLPLLLRLGSCMTLSWLSHVQDQSAGVHFGEVSFGEGSIQCWCPSEV